MLKFGITLPYGDARSCANLAQRAETAGWDGIFVGDAIWCHDPLIQLSAAAIVTNQIRLGTLVLATPLRRPNHLASESLALDHLSNGRLILGLGMGATWMGWQAFPAQITETRARAEMLDETIEILTRMQQSEQFDFIGKHYQVQLSKLDPMYYPTPTIQQPHVPIWIPGVWPRQKSLQRVLKCNGLLPYTLNEERAVVQASPEEVAEMRDYILEHHQDEANFDIVIEGKTAGLSQMEAEETLGRWQAAGATWWIESMWDATADEVLKRIEVGPGRDAAGELLH